MDPQNEPIKILHVDKDESFLEVTHRILNLLGTFEVDTAQTVNEANKALSQKKYDAIISAYYLNTINGLEYYNQLRAKGVTAQFILFTINEETAKEAKQAGIPFVGKYGDPEKVFSKLAEILKNGQQ